MTGPETPDVAAPAEPTPSIAPSDGSYQAPAGTALPIDVDAHPEALVGAAFAGGLLAGIVLKKLTGAGR